MCEHAARGGGSRPLHLRPVDTICFKLNKIGLQIASCPGSRGGGGGGGGGGRKRAWYTLFAHALNVLQLKSNFQIIGLTFICTDSTPC